VIVDAATGAETYWSEQLSTTPRPHYEPA